MHASEHKSQGVAISWAKQIAQQLEQRADRQGSEGIHAAIDQLESSKFQIAILGKAKRGKSTLINAMLGRSDDNFAPIDKLPASSAISRFRWADQEKAQVRFRDGRQESIAAARVRDFVTEELNSENHKQVDLVDIEAPFSGLAQDLTLVDTPGAGSIHQYHDALLHAFIPQADAVIFLVTASMPLDQDELDLLAQVRASDIPKVFFVVNKVDERSQRDIHDAIRHNQSLLSAAGISADRFHLLSAKLAFEGNQATSGLLELKAGLDDYLTSHRGRVLRERFVSRVVSQASPALLGLSVELGSCRKSTETLDGELQTLRARKRSLESERHLAEREFQRVWKLALDQFQQGVCGARETVLSDVSRSIAETSVLDISKVARELPTELNRIIERRLAPIARTFEQTTQEATQQLDAAYPVAGVGDAGSVQLRTKETTDFTLGLLGGGAAAAAGLGVAAAGGAAAAGIAAANAAALAATTTVAAPSIASGLLTLAGLDILAPLAMGTATVSAPAALAATPLWVALSGPVGWTLAGVGLLAVPFSWRLSKLKLKDKLESAAREQVNLVFDRLQSERVPSLHAMSQSILEEYRIRLDRTIDQVEAAIVQARDHRPSDAELYGLEQLAARLGALLRSDALPTS